MLRLSLFLAAAKYRAPKPAPQCAESVPAGDDAALCPCESAVVALSSYGPIGPSNEGLPRIAAVLAFLRFVMSDLRTHTLVPERAHMWRSWLARSSASVSARGRHSIVTRYAG